MKKLKLTVILIVLTIKLNEGAKDYIGSIGSRPDIVFEDLPCNGTKDITSTFLPGLVDGYKIIINRELNKRASIKLKFDLEALVTVDETLARKVDLGGNTFKLVLLKDVDKLEFDVKGQFQLLPPYATSIKIDGEENCRKPNFGYFERHPSGAEKRPDIPDLFCGKRKAFNKLVINGAVSKPGDWPWHVALFRIEAATLKYICGGTLVSNTFVLTAAHCVTVNDSPVLPESLGITLGKHNLIGGDVVAQEREVYEVIVHEKFKHRTLDNDIALLKMKTPVEYSSNIQPACIWFDKAEEKLPPGEVFGTVTGWGFDQTESLSTVLREATMPIIPDLKCIRSKPLFYSTILDGTKFCAGHRNGTSACNGDSGGGFFIYVPYKDSSFVEYYVKGAWYVRGLVSLSVSKQSTKNSLVSICDPNEYVVFTDVSAYTDWIYDHMD